MEISKKFWVLQRPQGSICGLTIFDIPPQKKLMHPSVQVPRSSHRREQPRMLFRCPAQVLPLAHGSGGAVAAESRGPHSLVVSGEQDHQMG